MQNVEENNGSEVGEKAGLSITEKAQYAAFANGNLPPEVIGRWIRNDLESVRSLVTELLSDKELFNSIREVYYKRYKQLAQQGKFEDNDESK